MSCKATRASDRAKAPSGGRHLFLELESCSFTSQTPNVAGEPCTSSPGEERGLLPSEAAHPLLAHARLLALAGGLSPPPSPQAPQGSLLSNRRVLPSDFAIGWREVGGRPPRSCEAHTTSLRGCTRPGSAPDKLPHSGCRLPCGISMGRTRRDIAHSLAWVLRSARTTATWPAS